MATLKEVMHDLMECTYDNTKARKFADVEVVQSHYSHDTRWPGTQKNVHFWVELANGKAVGWNENPATGWSFPVHVMKVGVSSLLQRQSVKTSN